MPSEAQVLAIDRVPDKTAKRCSICRHSKSTDDFALDSKRPDGRDGRCKRCRRLHYNAYYHEGGGKEVRADYNAQPEVQERHRRYNAAKTSEQRRESNLAYRATLRGRLVFRRCQDRCRLRRATDPRKRATIEARLALYDREIARLDRGHELPAEPVPPAGDCDYRGVIRTRHGTFTVVVSVPGKGQVYGGSYATIEEARRIANRVGEEQLGVEDYAVPKWRRA